MLVSREIFKHNGLRAKLLQPMKAIREDGMVITMYKNEREDKVSTGVSSSRGKYFSTKVKTPDGEYLTKYVHRLVAEAFIPNPDGLSVVDHINEDSTDNRVENLRWATLEGNNAFYNFKDDRKIMELRKLNIKHAKLIREYTDLAVAVNKEVNVLNDLRDRALVAIRKAEEQALNNIQQLADRLKVSTNVALPTIKAKTRKMEDMIKATAKPVKVNGKTYQSAREAAKVICEDPDVVAKIETVRKEIQRFVNGKRPAWLMYGKYQIG